MSSRCPWRSHHWPKMLVANTPVSSRPSSITITPSPGTVRRNWIEACAPTGSTICEPLKQPQEHAVEQAEDRLQDPDRDGEREPDQQAGNQVAFHASLRGDALGLAAAAVRATGGRWCRRRLGGRGCRGRRIGLRDLGAIGRAGGLAAASAAPSPPFASPPFGRRSSQSRRLRRSSRRRPASADLPDGLSPRKSVTYQPEPFNWKPAAVTCLRNVDSPQAGHTVSTGSETFCSTSFA